MQEKLEREELGGKIHTMESDVSYRCIGEDFDEGVVACGFMRKRTRGRSQIDFQIGYYSGFFLLGGSGLYVMGDGREFPIRAGDFVQRLPGEMHSTYVEPDGEWLEFFVSFGRERYQVMKKLGLLPETRVNRCPVEDMLEDCAVHLGRLKEAKDRELGILLARQEMLLHELLRHGQAQVGREMEQKRERMEKAGEPAVGRMENHSDKYAEKMRQAADILSANPSANLNMEEVAESLSMGYETFRKQFRKRTGLSPADYRMRHKMRQACHMLDAGISIKETAALTGYADVYTFTRQFAKTMGSTPGKYRGRKRERET
ncbi:MAG: AraC family transcriptional regulator [Ruminococcus sp.]|nr:AraC family transcriptional regulator [Ruminococcus sp.]